MPASQPGAQDVHVDQILTNMSIAYMQDARDFVASIFAPSIKVEKQSDKYYIFDKDAWFRDEMEARAGASASAGGGYTLSSDTYFSTQYSYHKDVPRDVKANTDNPLNWRRNATQFVMQKALLRREMLFAANCMGTGIWATDVVGGAGFTVWSNTSTGTPINDIETGRGVVQAATGFLPNTLVLGSYAVWSALKHHPTVVDRYKHTSADSITPAMVAQVLELDRVLISRAVKNTADEGAAASMASVGGNNALLAYVAPNPGIEVPSAAYSFDWTKLHAESGMNSDVVVSSFDLPELNGTTRIEADMCTDIKVTGADLGYFFSAAI